MLVWIRCSTRSRKGASILIARIQAEARACPAGVSRPSTSPTTTSHRHDPALPLRSLARHQQRSFCHDGYALLCSALLCAALLCAALLCAACVRCPALSARESPCTPIATDVSCVCLQPPRHAIPNSLSMGDATPVTDVRHGVGNRVLRSGITALADSLHHNNTLTVPGRPLSQLSHVHFLPDIFPLLLTATLS
eukprot:1762111-Rhodomonas_salina.2